MHFRTSRELEDIADEDVKRRLIQLAMKKHEEAHHGKKFHVVVEGPGEQKTVEQVEAEEMKGMQKKDPTPSTAYESTDMAKVTDFRVCCTDCGWEADGQQIMSENKDYFRTGETSKELAGGGSEYKKKERNESYEKEESSYQ